MNVKTILDKTMGVKKIRVNFMELLTLFLIGITFLLVSTFNFARGRFEWSRLVDGSFWLQYVLTIGLSIFIFFLTVSYTKTRLKARSKNITKLNDEIGQCSETAQTNAADEFDKHIEAENDKALLGAYINKLYLRMSVSLFFAIGAKAKERATKKWQTKIANAKNEYKNHRVKLRLISVSLFHTGYSSKKAEGVETLQYSGQENMGNYLLPTLFFGLCFTLFVLAFRIEGYESTLDVFVQLVSRLITMSLFVMRGHLYGEYSINTVYTAVLKNRRAFLINFLKSQDFNVVFGEEEQNG